MTHEGRTTLVLGMSREHIARLVAKWQWGTSIIENDDALLEVVALFDHDYEQHLLVLEHDRASHRHSYSLWFLGVHIDASFIRSWDVESAPFVEASILVQGWVELARSIRN